MMTISKARHLELEGGGIELMASLNSGITSGSVDRGRQLKGSPESHSTGKSTLIVEIPYPQMGM